MHHSARTNLCLIYHQLDKSRNPCSKRGEAVVWARRCQKKISSTLGGQWPTIWRIVSENELQRKTKTKKASFIAVSSP